MKKNEKIIEEVTEEATETTVEETTEETVDETAVVKVGKSVKKGVPKIAKIAAVGAIAVAGFILGVKVSRKRGESDSEYVDCDYEVADDNYETDINE